MPSSRSEPSILKRLMWSLALVVLCTTSVVLFVYNHLGNQRAEIELEHRVDEFSSNLAKGLEVPVWSCDLDAVHGLVDAFALNADVADIVVAEPSGEILAEFHRPQPGARLTRTQPVFHGGFEVGRVEVSLSPVQYETAGLNNLRTSLALAGFFTLMVLVGGSALLTRFFHKPMRQLQCIVNNCAAGRYDIPETAPAAEFREFTGVLGNMAAGIKKHINELRNTRDALERSERRFNMALDAAEDGLWDWDIMSGRTFFSPRYYTMLGYEPGGFPATIESWKKLTHSEDADRVMEQIRAHFKSGEPFFERFRMRAKDGSWRWIQGRGRVVEHDAQGRPVRMAGIHTDVTAQIRVENELRQMQGFLTDVINSMPSVLVGMDLEGRVTHWNLGAERATGIAASEAAGQSVGRVLPALTDVMDKIQQAVLTRTPFVESRRPRRVGDETRYEDVVVYPLGGGIKGAVIRMDDVTERVRIDEVLIQSEKMLSVGGLAAGMAHEINNPLAGILGTVQVLRNRLFGDMKKNVQAAEECGIAFDSCRKYLRLRGIDDMLDGVEVSGERAARIVANMLRFSRKSNRHFSRCSLSDLLDGTMELASSDYDLKKGYDFRRIEVDREYDPDMPDVWCEGGELQQVFLNLLRNGAEAMAEKNYAGERPRFVLRLMRDNGYARVEIEDNGPGMDEAVRKRAFEPFFTSKGPGRGTGLGLSVSYFIITEQHGGNMEVRSVPGQGARFIIRLPVDGSPDAGTADF